MKSLIPAFIIFLFSSSAFAYTYKVQNYRYNLSCEGNGAQFSLATQRGFLIGTGSFYGTDGATHAVQFKDGMTGQTMGSEHLQSIDSQGAHHRIGFYGTSFQGQPDSMAGPAQLVAVDSAVFKAEKVHCSVQSAFVGTETRVHKTVCVKQWAHAFLNSGYDHWETVCD